MYKIGPKVRVRDSFKYLEFNKDYYRTSGEICENPEISIVGLFSLPEQMQKYSGKTFHIGSRLPYDPTL